MKKLLIIVFIIFMAAPFALNAEAKTLVPKNFESGGYGGLAPESAIGLRQVSAV